MILIMPLPSNESFRQLTPVYIPLKPRERNSRAVYFSNMVNPLLFKKVCLYVLLKHIRFFFNQMIFLVLILRLLFFDVNFLFVQNLVHRMHVRLLSLLLLYVTVKTSLIVLYAVILSIRVVLILIE